jgi:hypothetical protein
MQGTERSSATTLHRPSEQYSTSLNRVVRSVAFNLGVAEFAFE